MHLLSKPCDAGANMGFDPIGGCVPKNKLTCSGGRGDPRVVRSRRAAHLRRGPGPRRIRPELRRLDRDQQGLFQSALCGSRPDRSRECRQTHEVCEIRLNEPIPFSTGILKVGRTLYVNTARFTVAFDAATCAKRWQLRSSSWPARSATTIAVRLSRRQDLPRRARWPVDRARRQDRREAVECDGSGHEHL